MERCAKESMKRVYIDASGESFVTKQPILVNMNDDDDDDDNNNEDDYRYTICCNLFINYYFSWAFSFVLQRKADW
jgi:hypothetical protein